MREILIIADDLTGALDTGIQFGAGKISIQIGPEGFRKWKETAADMPVCIVDAETRHMKPEDAYRTVYNLAAQAREAGIQYVYKKTDSALRGNVGSELSAVLEAYGAPRLFFAPAFPKMRRITRGGVHYIDGCPVADSVFGQDPYEPVQASRVEQILQRGCCNVPVHAISAQTEELPEGILAYDCATDEEMARIAGQVLDQPGPHLLAGCAGFAAALSNCLGLAGQRVERPPFSLPLSVICGSKNPVTVGQVEAVQQRGAVRIPMAVAEKLDSAWMDTPAGRQRLLHWKEQLEGSGCSILESFSDLEGEDLQASAQAAGMEKEAVRLRIASAMGETLKRLLELGLERTLLITGGDTLLAFLKQAVPNRLSPVCEVVPGVVCLRMEYGGKTYLLLTKSGGFGDRQLMEKLWDIVGQSAENGVSR